MNFNKRIEVEYIKIEKELANIAEEMKRRKAEIDQEMKIKESVLKEKVDGLGKYLVAVGLRDKEVKKKPKPKPEK